MTGDFKEIRLGDPAAEERAAIRYVTKDVDRIKIIEQCFRNPWGISESQKQR